MDNEIGVIRPDLASFNTFRIIKRSFLHFILGPSRVGGFHFHPTKKPYFGLFSVYLLYRPKMTFSWRPRRGRLYCSDVMPKSKTVSGPRTPILAWVLFQFDAQYQLLFKMLRGRYQQICLIPRSKRGF